MEERMLLASGPVILGISPTEVRNATFDHVDVTFNGPIDPSSFTIDDVTIAGPSGAVSPTAVTELDASNYRVSFDALTIRGIYHVTIGPNITNPSGNMMDQNQNGTAGELSGDQFVASLLYVQASTIFTKDTVIHEGDTTYDSQDIAVAGGIVTIDGPHSFNSVQLIDGAVLTHSATTATQTHKLDLTVSEQVIVDATSEIDVTSKS
jgi:hypothetical protein